MLPRSRPPWCLPALGVGCLLLLVGAGTLLTEPVSPQRTVLASSTSPSLAGGQHVLRRITTDTAFRGGRNEGTAIAHGSLTISTPIGRMSYAGRRWAWSRWSSAWVDPGQRFTELLPSWNAVTPPGTWIQVQARVRDADGRISTYKTMGSWTTRDAAFRRTSAGSQGDTLASVSTDTLVAAPGVSLAGYQLRVLLLRPATATSGTPTLRSVQAVASLPASSTLPTSRRLLPGHTLDVPRYSQMTHQGQYPQYGGGGQAWCSPTSLSMILGYYRDLPSAANYAWVSRSYADPWVDHVARMVYDYGYSGAGNWAFNTAYASVLTGDAFVTRLPSLREAEEFIAAGIPLAASISFSPGQLTGAPISSTAGHLVVISGFTRVGNVVVNDPAAPSNASVRRVYDRGQFERVWQQRSHGTVYVVHDAAHPLPARGSDRSW